MGRSQLHLRALIVDDEAPARQHLRDLLCEIPGVDLVGEASDAHEAEKLLLAVEHDVVFLDIRMPGLDGIEAAELFASLPKSPYVVFTTAYEEYAARAFELGATDYLLKPISKSRLQQAVTRAWERKSGAGGGARRRESAGVQTEDTRELQYMTARRGHKMVLIDVEDIAFMRVEGETIHIMTADDTAVALAASLDQVEGGLSGSRFFRAHRSFLVNLRFVDEVVPMFNRTYELVMKDVSRSRVPVSRRKAVELRELLGF